MAGQNQPAGADIKECLFRDREDAGRQLAAKLERYRAERPIVLGLPRGGVPVAAEIALVLDAPLGVLPVRKLGAPGHREYGIGAIASGGASVVDWEAVRELRITDDQLERVTVEERAELERQQKRFGEHIPPMQLRDRTIILVDDGLATGVSAMAAIRAAGALGAARIVLAVPVSAPETAALLTPQVDKLVCVARPPNFRAVGLWYGDFAQTSDETVIALLNAARRRITATGPN